MMMCFRVSVLTPEPKVVQLVACGAVRDVMDVSVLTPEPKVVQRSQAEVRATAEQCFSTHP